MNETLKKILENSKIQLEHYNSEEIELEDKLNYLYYYLINNIKLIEAELLLESDEIKIKNTGTITATSTGVGFVKYSATEIIDETGPKFLGEESITTP